MFNSLTVKTDVTSLFIHDNLLLAGIGGFLSIFKTSNSLIQRKKIFEGQKIYGIVPCPITSEIIIYGGKNIALVSVNSCSREITIIQSFTLSDWILYASWIEEAKNISTVFMHNKVNIWKPDFTKIVSVKCEERCILYSAHIAYKSYKDLVILSGTVFSEILLWKPYITHENGYSPVLARLKYHKGVIFHLDYSLDMGYICSASDDRSAVLWKVKNKDFLKDLNENNKECLEIDVACQVYGHSSRVFQSCIARNFFITAGEDSLVIIWSFEGSLLRKFDTHQGGTVWCVEYDEANNVIFTGGNDGGISMFKINTDVSTSAISLENNENPKHVSVLSSQDIVCLSETATLYYYNKKLGKIYQVARHDDLKSYSILNISPCHRMIALAGYHGQIYLYRETQNRITELCRYTFKEQSRIFSFHWLNCRAFLVCQNQGKIFLCVVRENKVWVVQVFILPCMRERWSTCACYTNNHVIIGDRKGNVYNYKIGSKNPVNSYKKAHSHLGVTNLCIAADKVISLGKDGILKKYKLIDGYLHCTQSTKTKFTWLASLDNNYLYSFSGNNFIIADYTYQRALVDISCGGGHRSWSSSNVPNNFTFAFVKQKQLHIIQTNLDHFVPIDILPGYHVREINCVKVLQICSRILLISGGEDTILRISVLDGENVKVLQNLKVHLSSIRVIFYYKLTDDNFVLFSAGGRAQIICWNLRVNCESSGILSVTCTEKYNFYELLNEDEAEDRIMDLSMSVVNGEKVLFAACSNGNIKIFSIDKDLTMSCGKTIHYKQTCLTKLLNVSWVDHNILITLATDGYIVFWDTTHLINSEETKPLTMFRAHQSGISSCCYRIVADNDLLLLTGGDDNAVVLSLFKMDESQDKLTIMRKNQLINNGFHCGQVTGSYIGDGFMLTCSIDQKIILYDWRIAKETITVEFVSKYLSPIADQQGLHYTKIGNMLHIFIYGNGIEHLTIIPNIIQNYH